MLDDRSGPSGEALRFSLSHSTSLNIDQAWDLACAEEEMRRRGEEVHFEREWGGLGFGTGAEVRDCSALEANAKVTVGFVACVYWTMTIFLVGICVIW
jgi:hypothetical protein